MGSCASNTSNTSNASTPVPRGSVVPHQEELLRYVDEKVKMTSIMHGDEEDDEMVFDTLFEFDIGGDESDETIYLSYFCKTLGPMKCWSRDNFKAFRALRQFFMESLGDARKEGKDVFKWEEYGLGGMGPL